MEYEDLISDDRAPSRTSTVERKRIVYKPETPEIQVPSRTRARSAPPTSARSKSAPPTKIRVRPRRPPSRVKTPSLTIPPRITSFNESKQMKLPKQKQVIQKVTPLGVVLVSKKKKSNSKKAKIEEIVEDKSQESSESIYKEDLWIRSPQVDTMLRDRPKSALLFYSSSDKSVRTGGFQAIYHKRALSSMGMI